MCCASVGKITDRLAIRSFEDSDKLAVIALWGACDLVVPWNDPAKDISRKQLNGTDLFLVGEVRGEIIASAMGGYDGHRGWVNYLAVVPAEQGKGYARAMMKALEARLIEQGCPKLNLQIRETNIDVIAFYRALGYQQDACVSFGKRLIADEPIG